MKKIYFITSNKGKVLEAQNKLSHIQIEQKNMGYPEIQADTLKEVATYGIKYIEKNLKEAFILEDAGLFIKNLKGFPGVYSAYVFKTIGCAGILDLMKNLEDKQREATFKSVFAYKEQNKAPQFFIGETLGKITQEMKGKNGFGYDPIFKPYGRNNTFAEMNTEDKNRISHRGKALEKLSIYLKNNL